MALDASAAAGILDNEEVQVFVAVGTVIAISFCHNKISLGRISTQ
jgi:hypothetical protein